MKRIDFSYPANFLTELLLKSNALIFIYWSLLHNARGFKLMPSVQNPFVQQTKPKNFIYSPNKFKSKKNPFAQQIKFKSKTFTFWTGCCCIPSFAGVSILLVVIHASFYGNEPPRLPEVNVEVVTVMKDQPRTGAVEVMQNASIIPKTRVRFDDAEDIDNWNWWNSNGR